MSYAEYLGKHSYLHLLARNILLGKYPRLIAGLSPEVYEGQLSALASAVKERNHEKL